MALGKWKEWAADRFGWKPFRKNVLDRRVPSTPWYFGGGAALLFLLGVLVLTGAFLTLTYSPHVDAAYPSVAYITEEQTMGWLVRGLHYWCGGLMVVMLFWHLFRQILVGGYKSPREGTWLIGVFMFFAVITTAFIGYLLRWDERSIYALRVALSMFYNVPWLGEWLVVFVQGGSEVGPLTLSRLFSVHVIFIPLLLGLLLLVHLYLVILHGITSVAERERPVHSAEEQKKIYKKDIQTKEHGDSFYPVTMAKTGATGLIVFAVALLLTLAVGPARLYPEANLVERSIPVEEWWFWWYSGLIALLPPSVAPAFMVLFPILLFVFLVALPFVDRGPLRGIRNRPIAAAIVALCVIAILFLSDLRRRSPWTGWPRSAPPDVPKGIVLTPEVEEGRQLFWKYGCSSCHAVSGEGQQVGPDLALLRNWSRTEYRDYILQPPAGVAMPSYAGRMSDEELELVIDFIHTAQTFPRKP